MNNHPFEIEVHKTPECLDFEEGWESKQVYENAQIKELRWVLVSKKESISKWRDYLSQFCIWLACQLGKYTGHIEIDIVGDKLKNEKEN